LVAADSNGKSDPYPVVYQRKTEEKGVKKLARKYRVKPKTLDPVWDTYFAELQAPKDDAIVYVDLYDKDTVNDDFLGKVEINVKDTLGKGQVTIPLQPRDGKKDKVKGTITFEFKELGVDTSELGFSLTSHYAVKLGGKEDFSNRMAIRKMWDAYVALAGTKGGITAHEWQLWQKKINPEKVNSEDDIKALARIYDDNYDGLTNFFELMKFYCDAVAQGSSAMGKARFTLTGAFSALVDDTGKVDQTTLRTVLTAFIPDAEHRDPEKMNHALDDAVKEVMEGLDSNHDGTITMREVREYILDGPGLATVIQELRAIPMKS